MAVVIQNTWTEEDDQELLEYCKKYETVILSKEEILKLSNVISDKCFFLHALHVSGFGDLPFIVIVPTYPWNILPHSIHLILVTCPLSIMPLLG